MTTVRYVNNHGFDEYYIGNFRLARLEKVKIDKVIHPVIQRTVTVEDYTKGQEFRAASTHYFIVLSSGGATVEVDLNQIKSPITALSYALLN